MRKHFDQFGVPGLGRLRPEYRQANIMRWREKMAIAADNARIQYEGIGTAPVLTHLTIRRSLIERFVDWLAQIFGRRHDLH